MSGESSYFSRFFVKFVEVSAAGLASAICAYLLALFGGLLPAPAPATAVQVGPTAGETPESRRAQPSPSVEQRSAPQRDTDAAVAQPALKSVKDAKAVPPRKPTKTDTSVTEKEPHQKSAEALARAALANVDTNRPAPPDATVGPDVTYTPAPADSQSRRANVPQRQNVGPPQPVTAPPPARGMRPPPGGGAEGKGPHGRRGSTPARGRPARRRPPPPSRPAAPSAPRGCPPPTPSRPQSPPPPRGRRAPPRRSKLARPSRRFQP